MINLTKITAEQANKIECALISLDLAILNKISINQELANDNSLPASTRKICKDEAKWWTEVYDLLYKEGEKNDHEGRWKGAGLGDYYCSRCCTTYSGGDEFNFCPNCGAYMK